MSSDKTNLVHPGIALIGILVIVFAAYGAFAIVNDIRASLTPKDSHHLAQQDDPHEEAEEHATDAEAHADPHN